MKTNESTGQILIVATPEGEPPLYVREAWVGLVLPCSSYYGSLSEVGVLSREKVSPTRCGFSVPQAEAIAILEKSKPEAAAWWKTNGFPEVGQYFGFAEEEAKIISGVTRQRIVQVTDEMRGHPTR